MPRSRKFDRKRFRILIFSFGLLLVFWFSFFYVQNRHVFNRPKILSTGTPTQATVTAKWTSKGSCRIEISFLDHSGNHRSVSSDYFPGDYHRVNVGESVPIHFLKDDPELYAIDSFEPDLSPGLATASTVLGIIVLCFGLCLRLCFEGTKN